MGKTSILKRSGSFVSTLEAGFWWWQRWSGCAMCVSKLWQRRCATDNDRAVRGRLLFQLHPPSMHAEAVQRLQQCTAVLSWASDSGCYNGMYNGTLLHCQNVTNPASWPTPQSPTNSLQIVDAKNFNTSHLQKSVFLNWHDVVITMHFLDRISDQMLE